MAYREQPPPADLSHPPPRRRRLRLGPYNSADYTEWAAGIGIQIFFEPQNLFWTRKEMFREFGKHSNK